MNTMRLMRDGDKAIKRTPFRGCLDRRINRMVTMVLNFTMLMSKRRKTICSSTNTREWQNTNVVSSSLYILIII